MGAVVKVVVAAKRSKMMTLERRGEGLYQWLTRMVNGAWNAKSLVMGTTIGITDIGIPKEMRITDFR